MSDETKATIIVYGGSFLLVFGLGFGIAWFQAYMEAKTYNKITGAHVTTWDAMWVDLRIQESPKK